MHIQSCCILPMLCFSAQVHHNACGCCVTCYKTPALASNCKFYPVHLSDTCTVDSRNNGMSAPHTLGKVSSHHLAQVLSCLINKNVTSQRLPVLCCLLTWLRPVTCDLSLQACADPCCNMGARCCPCCNDLPCTLPASLVNLFQH